MCVKLFGWLSWVVYTVVVLFTCVCVFATYSYIVCAVRVVDVFYLTSFLSVSCCGVGSPSGVRWARRFSPWAQRRGLC